MLLTVRNVDKNIWHKFKRFALESQLPVGKALNISLSRIVSEHNKPKAEKHYGLDLKPVRLTEPIPNDISRNIDKYLYGE
ncbi:hypothetical protein HYU06_05375 [Candidatus Woesearchaeota archaeon]|nr:hypothetical protein [Candidatus Woesearchaeota archaeon]